MAYSGIASGIIGGLFNLGSTITTNEYNQEIARQQRQHEINLWEMNNEYNDPSNQIARLENAGLNPDLVYGNPAQNNLSGNSSAPAGSGLAIPAQAPKADPYLLSQLQKIEADIYKTNMEGDNVDKQNQILDETGLAQALANLGVTKAQEQDYLASVKQRHQLIDQSKKYVEQMDNNIKLIQEKVKEVQKNAHLLDLKAMSEQELTKIYQLQQFGLQLSNEQQQIINKYLPQKLCSEIDKNVADAQESRASAKELSSRDAYNEANTLLTKSNKAFVDNKNRTETEKRRGISIDNDIKEIQKKYEDERQIMGLIESGTRSFENIADGVGNFIPKVNINNNSTTIEKKGYSSENRGITPQYYD